jgi:hypothetical protein
LLFHGEQWLRERFLVLRYAYVAFLVFFPDLFDYLTTALVERVLGLLQPNLFDETGCTTSF